MDIPTTIILGIVSGILTSALLLLIINIFKKIIIPWYQITIYRGIDINGVWKQEIQQNKDDKENYTLSLKQKGHILKGTLSIFQSHKETVGEIVFEANGELLDGNVILSMKTQDIRQQGMATILAKCTGGGVKLEGSLSFLNAYKDKIHAIPISLQRSLQ